jgi:hypothetical protein
MCTPEKEVIDLVRRNDTHIAPVLLEGGTRERNGCGGCWPLVLAQRAHQIHRIARKPVLVEARSERPISLYP